MKPILLILPATPDYLPYVETYLQLFRKNRIDFYIICWNRTDKFYQNDDTISVFNLPINNNASYFQKLKANFLFYRHCKKHIKPECYGMAIIHTMSLGFVFSHYLKTKFKKRFIFDIRDCSSIINNKIVNKVLYSLILKANCVVLSSRGFVRYLPPRDYVVVHNTTIDSLSKSVAPKSSLGIEAGKKITILTNGLLRLDPNIVMMDQLGNSKHFNLRFAGAGEYAGQLKEYIENKKFNNVLFQGWYDKIEEDSIIKATDLISIYLTHDQNSDILMANRFYLSAIFRRPMIVNENTYQADVCRKYGLGVILNNYESFEVQLLDYCNKYNPIEYEKGCRAFIKDVEYDMKIFEKSILEALN